jgi:hypothetical protein
MRSQFRPHSEEKEVKEVDEVEEVEKECVARP